METTNDNIMPTMQRIKKELKELTEKHEKHKQKTQTVVVKLADEINVLKHKLNEFIEARDAPILSRQCLDEDGVNNDINYDETYDYNTDLLRAKSCLYSA